jgi:predicted ATP-grasp superfamily ATP-dependent carboligase
MPETTSLIVGAEQLASLKYGLLGLPDTGLVGTIAVGHTIHSKNMNKVAYVNPSALPPMLVIHNGEPESPIRIYVGHEFFALISEAPMPYATYKEVVANIVGLAKEKRVELLISITGIAVQNRLEIKIPEVSGIGSTADVRSILKSRGFPLLEEGFIAGPQALALNECIEQNVPMAVLIAQSHAKFPDPAAAVSVLNRLNQAFGFNIDVKMLQDQAEEFRIRLRELMQRTQQSMRNMKTQEQELPAMYG